MTVELTVDWLKIMTVRKFKLQNFFGALPRTPPAGLGGPLDPRPKKSTPSQILATPMLRFIWKLGLIYFQTTDLCATTCPKLAWPTLWKVRTPMQQCYLLNSKYAISV